MRVTRMCVEEDQMVQGRYTETSEYPMHGAED